MTKIIHQYYLDELTGQDAYGFDIYQARHMKNSDLFTVRNVSNVNYTSANFFQDSVKNEISILKKVSHSNLVSFVKMFKTANNIYMVYEYCSGGTLYDRVLSEKLTETQQNNYIRQLQQGVRQLHSYNIIHMNLNPHTIFIGSGGVLKIGNFAHARDLTENPSAEYDLTRMKHTDFLAPEQLLKQPATLKIDIYSLGLIFAFIKHGKKESVQALLLENSKCKDIISETIQEMVVKDPSKRIDIESVKVSLGLGGVPSKKSSSPIHHSARQNIRKISQDLLPLRSHLAPGKSPNKEPNSAVNKSMNNNTSLLVVPSNKRNMKSERQYSDAKSYIGNEEQTSQNSLAKRILRQRNKSNYLILISHDIAEQELAPASSKLSFMVAKKAYIIAKRLKVQISEIKEKTPAQEDLNTLIKIVSKEIEDVQSFYKALTNCVRTNQKKLLGDSAFDLQTQQQTLNEAYLRKITKQYTNSILPKVDLVKPENQEHSRMLLQHLNNLSDVQQLDRFFTNFINSSVANLLDQVYFLEVDKMELKDLHRFVSEKIPG